MTDPTNLVSERPSPEALLEAARREDKGVGKLRIFVGAAPGVGKTYEMLRTARARRKDGYDVIVGVVETHGRKETQALVRGLEVVPRRHVEYRGQMLEEMDLDAIIVRHPQLVLVDELAHTNAPGSRHPKRYLDVEELLGHGIDVYTTVNIQHIESLNDIVAQITHVRVRETVPDAIFDRADAVEVVDLTPGDLIDRLKAGKVYIPAQAEWALENFFSPEKLTALRELALRRTAERVDEQLLSEMQARAIPGPWAAGERILVCITEEPRAAGLVRYAKRAADRLHAPWIALTVETIRSLRLSDEERDRIADTLRLAERMGGEAITMPSVARNVADNIITFARANNVTQIIVGKSDRSRWFEILHGSVVHDLIRRCGNIRVQVLSGDSEPVPEKSVSAAVPQSTFEPLPYVVSLLCTLVALAISWTLYPWLGVESVDLVFLTAIVGIAVRYGLAPSLVAGIAGSVFYNYFFLPPLYTLAITDGTNATAFVSFIIVAVIVSNVAGLARSQALIAANRAGTAEALYAFSRKLAGAISLDDVLWASAYQIASMLKVRVVMLLPEGGTIAVRAGYPPEDAIGESDIAAAAWAWKNDRAAGRGADTLAGAQRLFLPMRTSRGAVGVVGIDSDKPGPLLTTDQRRLFDALIDQAALAIERVRLVDDLERAARTLETDRLRSALLTSISHDLKTPLAAVLGSASALRDLSSNLDDAQKADLVGTIIEESQRLNRFIANLLDMTKLESGAIVANVAPHDLSEIVGSTLRRASQILAHHQVRVSLEPDLPMVRVDAVLFEQVLFNLLDNAAKYAPEGSVISIIVGVDGAAVRLQVVDEGDGIPASDVELIFDKFYRVQKGDRVRAGTGLGLAISRGFIEAMGGSIVAENRSDRKGAIFTIRIPASTHPLNLDTAA